MIQKDFIHNLPHDLQEYVYKTYYSRHVVPYIKKGYTHHQCHSKPIGDTNLDWKCACFFDGFELGQCLSWIGLFHGQKIDVTELSQIDRHIFLDGLRKKFRISIYLDADYRILVYRRKGTYDSQNKIQPWWLEPPPENKYPAKIYTRAYDMNIPDTTINVLDYIIDCHSWDNYNYTYIPHTNRVCSHYTIVKKTAH